MTLHYSAKYIATVVDSLSHIRMHLPNVLLNFSKVSYDAVLVELGVASGGRMVASQHFEGGSFTSTIHPQQTETFTLRHTQAQSIHRQVAT